MIHYFLYPSLQVISRLTLKVAKVVEREPL